ncbi:hypothetical protein HK105_201643 [Polyrhizophydium stewartii]|uniref:Uncharacterized protein n=1 Tax=Polyrhizophydium stewartii TaxID=2732419 RepID=A0ABR4NH78_9FUNG
MIAGTFESSTGAYVGARPADEADRIEMELRRPTTSTAMPSQLEPLALTDLYSHICIALSFKSKPANWRLPNAIAGGASANITSQGANAQPSQATFGASIQALRSELMLSGGPDSVPYAPATRVFPAMQPLAGRPWISSREYLSLFIDHFVNVYNCKYAKYERVFRENLETSSLIITHILSFAWTMLTEPIPEYTSPAAVREMRAQSDLVTVVKLIRILARLEQLAARVGQKHGIRVLLKIMQAYPHCMQLQINCSASLANLASIEENRIAMLECGCIKLVLENMSKFISMPAFQAEVCAALANLSCHEANARYIVANGGCNMIIRAMRMHEYTIDLQVQGFHALASLGRHGKEILERENFADLVIRSVTRHKDEVDLVSDIDEQAIQQYQGPKCILEVMKKYPTHESLQTTALFALGSVVMKSEQHRESVLEIGGINVILGALRRGLDPPAMPGDQHDNFSLHCKNETKTGSESHTFTDDSSSGAPEPVIFSRSDFSRVQCSKSLLLQLFGSVALLNLAESPIIDRGGVHYIFEASRRVTEHSDIWFILFYANILQVYWLRRSVLVLFDVTAMSCTDKVIRAIVADERTVYMQRKGVPSLVEIAKTHVMNTLIEQHKAAEAHKAAEKAELEAIAGLVPGIARLLTKPLFHSSTAAPWTLNISGNLASLDRTPDAPIAAASGPSGSSISGDPHAPQQAPSRPPQLIHRGRGRVPLLPEDYVEPAASEPPKLNDEAEPARNAEPAGSGDFDHLRDRVSRQLLGEHLKRDLLRANKCAICSSACFDNGIRVYSIGRAKLASIKHLCSLACAKKIQAFDSQPMFKHSEMSLP